MTTDLRKPRRRRPYGTRSTEGAAALSVFVSHIARERLFQISEAAEITAALVIERAVMAYEVPEGEVLSDIAPETSDRFRTFAQVPQRVFDRVNEQCSLHDLQKRVFIDHAILALPLDSDGVPLGWRVADPSPVYSLL